MENDGNFNGQIVSRDISKSMGIKHYFTGKSCIRGHVSQRRTSNGMCTGCSRENSRSPETREYQKKYHEENKDRRNKRKSERYYENREGCLKKSSRWYYDNRERILARERERTSSNEYRHKRNLYLKEKYEKDLKFRMHIKMRGMLKRLLDACGSERGDGRTIDIVGYSSGHLIDRLESCMLEGMTWDNYGDWHIDHIEPIKKFLDRGVNDPSVVNNLNNLCCMWADHNASKADKTLSQWLSEKGEDSEEWELYSRYL